MNASPRELKKLVICCDGTWNTPESQSHTDRYRPTNVLRMARAVEPADEQGRHQLMYYDSGVGTDGGLGYRLIGGLTGYGLSSHMLKAYRFICHNHVQGDELFFFGFSRGAYTVRALAGMIGAVGLLQKDDLPRLPEAFHYYNTSPERRRTLSFHNEFIAAKRTRTVPIKFLGVWDTVGALGVPVPGLRRLTKRWVGFFNTELGDHIEYGYHALAIDERRGPFKPDLWSSLEHHPERASLTKDVCQVWFPGSHSDVGGGAHDTALSDESLLWMMNRAVDCGLHIHPDARAHLHQRLNREASRPEDSYGLGYKSLIALGIRPHRRPIGLQPKDTKLLHKTPNSSPVLDDLKERLADAPSHAVNEMIHESAFQKYVSSGTSESREGYQPENLSPAISKLAVFRERYYHKRNHIRNSVDMNARVTHEQAHEDCRVLDFSAEGGAKLHMSDLQHRLGQTLVLEITENELAGSRYRGTVVWQHKFGLGLKFLSPA